MTNQNAPPHATRPIQNIWAVGRNYADHARELGNQVPEAQSSPMIFLKAGTTVVENGSPFSLPEFSSDIHHELEVALRFGSNLQFSEITVALDLTARDVQARLKAQGHPWTLAKSFKSSCPLGPFVPLNETIDFKALEFELTVNGALRQKGHTRDMIHSIENLRAYVLQNFPVAPGDVLLTGTPQGVARLNPGDILKAEIKGLVKAHWQVRP